MRTLLSRTLLQQQGQFANEQNRIQTQIPLTPEPSLIPLANIFPWGIQNTGGQSWRLPFSSTPGNTGEARGKGLKPEVCCKIKSFCGFWHQLLEEAEGYWCVPWTTEPWAIRHVLHQDYPPVSLQERSNLRVGVCAPQNSHSQSCRHHLHENHMQPIKKIPILGPEYVGSGTDAFNDSPDHFDVWLILRAMTSTDKQRED